MKFLHLSSMLAPMMWAAGVAASAQVCPLDYQVLTTASPTAEYGNDIIEVISQDTTSVTFKVNQLFSATNTDMYVQYKDGQYAATTCDEFSQVPLPGDVVITAKCLHTVAETVVDVFVKQPFYEHLGDTDLPQCCHGDSPRVQKYSFAVSCTPTCTPEPPNSCPETVLDFNDLPEFGYVSDEYKQSMGVTVTAKGDGSRYTPVPKSAYTPGSDWKQRYGYTDNGSRGSDVWQNLHNSNGGAARVFNTLKSEGRYGNSRACGSTDGDKDLGSPNELCPAGTPGLRNGGNNGPGVNNKGHSTTLLGWPNCPSEKIGNVLIIQESKKTCPDDTGGGGTITFDFDSSIIGSVQITLIKILDTDEGNTPEVRVWKSNRSLSSSHNTQFKTPGTGDNGLFFKDFSQDKNLVDKFTDIKRIQFKYYGSGSIAEIRYIPTSCPA